MSKYRTAIRFLFVAVLALPLSAFAANYDVKALIDTDNSRGTGCPVALPDGTVVTGIDTILTTSLTVTGNTGTVTAVTRQTCVGGAFGGPVPVDNGWNVGVSPTGDLLIESHLGPNIVTMNNVGTPRFVFTTTSGTLFDTLLQPATTGGGDIIMRQAGRDHAVATRPLRIITLDGSGSDWAGDVPLALGTDNHPALRFISVDGYAGANDLYFNFQIHTNPAAPTAHDDVYDLPTLGGTLSVSTLGVLTNDNPNGQSISALKVDNPQHGTVVLDPNGGFVYSNDGAHVAQDQFHYLANGTLPSNIATVTIGLVGTKYTFTSADHVIFTAGVPSSFTVTVTGKPTPALSEDGALPAGITFVDNGDGTGTLSGTPGSGTTGTYPLVFHAEKNKPHQADQLFTLTVDCPGITVTITPTPAQVCANSAGNTAAGPAGATTYAWSITNGTITSATNIQTITYTAGASGAVGLTLTVTNAAGCSATKTSSVTINPTPAATITPSPAQVCANSTGNSAAGPAGATSYVWSIANGTITSATNIQTITYTAGASGTVGLTLTVTNASGCPSPSNTVNVQINAIPATPTATNGGPYCAGATIALSTPLVAGATYSWTGPNGFTSALQNPTRTNATTADGGTYSVTVTVSGCTSAAGTTNVVVNPTPATPTASNTGPYCAGATIALSTPLVAGATYSWTGPNGFTSALQNPTRANATLADGGTYSVTVTVSGCTSAAGTTDVVVNPIPATPTASNTGPYCVGATISLSTPLVSGATYAWTGPNGFTSSLQNPTRTNAALADAGTYSVTVTVNGCTSAAGTTNVVVNPIPATPPASNGGPYCAGATIALSTPLVAGATYSWTGPNGFTSALQNPTRTNATTADGGTYSVTVTVSGCTSAAGTTNVVVNPTPATPTASNTGPYCAGATIALSTPLVAGATYSWTGPNGFTSALQNPTRTNAALADAGTYSVTVTVSGCTSAAGTTNVVVNAIPATPTASNGGPYCAGATIALSTPLVAGATYSWTGPNGFTSSLQNPTRANAALADAGTYSVTVTVNGCTSAAGTTSVVVNAIPATPTASNGGPYCAGATIALSTPLVAGATYSWTGPNGFTSALQNPTRTNATTADAGTYSVTVTVSGCTSAAGTTDVVVNPIPTTPTASNGGPYCAGATIALFTPAVAGATYSWTGPNGFTSSLQNPTRANATLADGGTYSVTVTVSGCTSAAGTTNVVVNAIPATPTASNGGPYCAGATIALSTPLVAGATYSWTGPNGFTSALQNPTRTNATTADAGTYSVTVTVSGCTSAAGTTNVVVNPTPATPTASNGGPYCAGATIALSTPLVAGATYSWTGPNGFTSALQNPTRTNATTADAGTYSVTVTVSGCTSAAGTTNVVVNAIPATPTASNGGPYCAGATIALSTPLVAGATYSWTGPNGFTSALQNPTRTNAALADAGTYSVTVTVSGCTSAAGTTSVVVSPIPATPTASNGGPYCAGATIALSTPLVAGATYSWTGPNGFTSALQNPTRTNATTADAGTYSVTVTVSGCSSAAGTTNVVVNPTPATPTASNGGPYCAGATIALSTSLVAGATYSWTGPNGFTSALQNPTRTNAALADGGTYSVTVTVSGCTSAAGTTNVVVNANPATPTITPTPAALCPSSTGNTASGPAATTWSWSIVNGTITSATTIQTITYTAGASGTTDLTLVVTNAAGCSASNTNNVPITGVAPVVTTDPVSQSVQSGSSVTFTAAASGTPVPTVQWQVSVAAGPFTDIGGATSTSLTFTAQLSQNGNQYRAVFTNTCGTATSAAATLTVTCPTITVTRNGGGTFPNGVFNTAYSGQSFTASGPPLVGPYTFALTGGTFPTGLSLASNGTISGTPTATGVFSFNVTATDTPSGCSSLSTAFSISIAPSAANDTYGAAFNIVDNTQFVVTGGSTVSPGTPFVGNNTLNILTNDSSDAAKTATPGTFATSAGGGGSVTIAADGTFIYTPGVHAAAITSDSFTYTVVSNGVTSTSATVTLTLANRVWYVKNSGGAGNGQSQSPFNTLAASEGANSAAGDFIFVYNGNNTTSGQNAGITLKNNQQLIGEGVALVVNTVTLVPVGTKPLISNTAGNAVTLANGNTLKGLDVTGPSANGINGTNTAGLTMDTMTIQGAGAASSGLVLSTPTGTVTITNTAISNSPFGLTINGGTAAFTMNNTNTISSNAGQRTINFANLGATAVVAIGAGITDSGIGMQIATSASGAQVSFTGSQTLGTTTNTAVSLTTNGGAIISFSGTLAITTTTGTGFSASGGGTLNVSGTANITTGASASALSLNGITVGGTGVDFDTVTATGATTAIALTNVTGLVTVNGGTITNGGTGISLQGTNTSLTLTNVTITGPTTGITNTTNFGTLTIGSSVNVSGVTALNLTTGALNGTFANLSSTGGTNGVALTSIGGTGWTGTTGSLAGATGAEFLVSGGSANMTYGGSITQNTAGLRTVDIQNRTGGTINLSGAIGSGAVFMNSNTGATMTFSGLLTLSTGATDAFTATAGGTVNVTNGSSTLASSTGTLLNIANTSVGGSGITFASANNSAAANGILIDTVGNNAITINGGTISNATTRGIDINGGGGSVTYAGSITTNNAAAIPLEVTNHTGGTVTIGGSISNTGNSAGINLTGNAGATITLSGSLNLDVAAGAALTASGGTVNINGTTNTFNSTTGNGMTLNGVALNIAGTSTTVTVTSSGIGISVTGGTTSIVDTASTGLTINATVNGQGFVASGGTVTLTGNQKNVVSTVTGTAVNVTTTIGGAGMTWKSVTAGNGASGPAKAIILSNAGSGNFTVTGDGSTANSGGIIQHTGGTPGAIIQSGTGAVDITGGSGTYTFSFVKILAPGGNGYMISNSPSTVLIEEGTIDHNSAVIANSFAVRDENHSGTSTVTLDGVLIDNKGDGSTATSVSAQDTGNINYNIQDSNTGDAFDMKFTNLFGSGVVVGAGDNAGATGTVNLTVSNAKFVAPMANGINDLEMASQANSVLNFNIHNNTFDMPNMANAFAGVINVNATQNGRIGTLGNPATIDTNTISNVTGFGGGLGYEGIRIAPDNAVGTPQTHRFLIQNNTLTNIKLNGLLMSARGGSTMHVKVLNNTIGTLAAPVGTTNRHAFFMETQANSSIFAQIANNPSIVAASTNDPNAAFSIDAGTDNGEGTANGTIFATITNNFIKSSASAGTNGFFRVRTNLDTSSVCLDYQSNTLRNSADTNSPGSLFTLAHQSGGTFTRRSVSNIGTESASGTIGSNSGCTLPTM